TPRASDDDTLIDHDPGAGVDRLPRRLGIWSAAAVLVGSTIGSGIFRVPSGVAERVETLGAFALIWIVGGLVALVGALTIAELAAMFPRSGGIYVFLREAYGPLPAFLFGWTELLVIRPSALGAIAMIFAEYAGRLFGYGPEWVRWVAAGTILVLASANIRSIRWGAAVQNLSTIAKVAAIVGLAMVAFAMGGGGGGGALANPNGLAPASWVGFGLALVSVMWAYDGWADLTFIAGEVRDPGRTMPRAIIGGVLGVIAIYLIVVTAYLFVLTMPEMAASTLVASDVAQKLFGAVGASVVAGMVMLSTFGALNGSTMTGPRIFYAMAEDGNFFRPIAAVHPRWKTPFAAIGLAAGLGIAYVLGRDFQQLADSFVLGIWPFYALAVLGVFRLRRTRPDAERPYRTWGYPVVPVLFLVGALGMLLNSAINDTSNTALGFGIMLAGIPAFFLWRAIQGRRPARS
ncbi:MAG TPA: amino acid permease, partial [Longimicrobium sp.]